MVTRLRWLLVTSVPVVGLGFLGYQSTWDKSKGHVLAPGPVAPRPMPVPGSGASLKSTAAPAPSAHATEPVPLAARLQAHGWTGEAARAFERQNGALLDELRASDPEGSERLVGRLERLATMRAGASVFRAVEATPELASLLAWSPAPDAVFEAWSGGEAQRRVLLNVLLLQDDPDRLAALAAGWKRHGRAVADCWRVGLVGAEAVLMGGRRDDQDDEYDRWTAGLFDASSFVSPQTLAARLVLVLEQGPELRRRLRTEPDFRQKFRSVLWPRMQAVTARVNRPLGLFVRHHRIWDVLGRADGVELTTTFGAIPADLLYGDAAYPAKLQPRVVALLRSRTKVAVATLMDPRLRADGRFCELLGRSLPDRVVLRIFDDLRQDPGGQDRLLGAILREDTARVVERYKSVNDLESWDDSLPAYLKVPRRWFAGEPLDDHDLPAAFVDAGFDLIGLGAMLFGAAAGVPEEAGEVVDGIQEGVDGLLAQRTKERVVRQKAQGERVTASTTPADSRRMIDESLVIDAAVSSLAAVQRMTADAGGPKGEAAWTTVKFFYASTTATASATAALEREGVALRFSGGNFLFLVPRAEADRPYAGLGREAWGREASRRWVRRALDGR